MAPATERLMTHSGHFTILYIVPTRALALDMHRRIHPLYKQLRLKSGIRTGDGKTLQDAKPDLLILTPESLDVLLGSHNPENKYFLKHIRVLIIDEVHTFLWTERGTQLSYLRRRLEVQSKGNLQTLTLSATIGDPDEINSFFHLKNVFYYQQSTPRKLEPCWVHIVNEKRELISFFDDLLSRWKCKKLLVFANSRKKCEQLFEALNYEGKFSNNVLLHYSNLSTKQRRHIESSFRTRKQSLCIATSTLEMGIDIGDIDGVVLMGPPPSTMAFLQRIGRGNRRKNYLKFWGVCYGAEAERQLLRFLALFELAKKNKLERRLPANHCSVLFQQILSSLYAKRAVSYNSLNALFNAAELPSMIEDMVAKDWLQLRREPGLFSGGWRYKIALQRLQIWSNFPPTDEEYEVILEKEVIASLPLSIIKQLEIGDIFQLTGKGLKLLQIEEKKASREVLVEVSDQPISIELSWYGCGPPISFEVAQAMKSILLGELQPEGLFNRTRRLLENVRRSYVQGKNGLYVHRLKGGAYRFETFLGTVGNFILYNQIQHQLSDKLEGLCVCFDELGIESNEWISFETLELPYSVSLFQEWADDHLPLLRQAFSWNSWLSSLPENLQKKEICSSLLDLRVLEHFERYIVESMPLPPPPLDENPQTEKIIDLLGKPWSFEEERQAWGQLSFPEIPRSVDRGLTASQIQSYVAQKNCPRLAHFQRVGFSIESHPRLQTSWQKSDFKKQVFKTLANLRFETADFTLKQAINEVMLSQTSLFLTGATLAIDQPFPMRGNPDLIYLKYEGSHVCLEVWDIKDQEHFSYAQKWRLAFYVYLLKNLLHEVPVIISDCAGLVHSNGLKQKRTPFKLAHFISWIHHLIAGWRVDSLKPPDQYSLKSNCTSCRYFSYCYQETLLKGPTSNHRPEIVCVAPESTDLPPNTDEWPSIQSFLQKHFVWPVDGRLTATQVARCLGLMVDLPPPISLYHDDVCVPPELYKQIWNWCASHVKCIRSSAPPPTNLIDSYLFMQRREWEERTLATLAFQKNPLSTRVEQCRAIGPLVFLRVVSEKREIRYFFSIDPKAPIAKFRVGDFLKLSLSNSAQIQDGLSVILTSYSPEEGTLSVQPLSGKMPLSKNQLYALDECATDWNAPKIETVLHRLKDPKFRPELIHMLHGHVKNAPTVAAEWVERWYSSLAERASLNSIQKQALLLPFLKNIGLIEGPPGTGKTHLLIWTLIALITHAKSIHRPIKILVTALSHQAIDQILLKLAQTFDEKEKIPIWKHGRFAGANGVALLEDVKLLMQNKSFILGATGFGVYQLFEGKQFPRVFDWVIFDEASQMLPSYALLSLVFGKGNALFYGDTQQLAPIVMADIPSRSILAELISRLNPQHRLRLKETYRMNDLICEFVSHHWYDQELRSSATNQRLELPRYPLFSDSIDAYLDPAKPLVVVPVEHEGNLQSSKEESLWIAQAVKRLTLDYCFPIDEIGIISPHRLQNNTILNALKEILPFSIRYPKIDTVERMQGQEFDLVLFSATVSDRESLHSAFLKDYRRFNVSISRARKKFLFVASPLFFKSFPRTERELIAHF
ncbi:MAG: DEAD/DEAH box helicase, partial [Chlamydiae bacterium]|nr:DEAD/DEAH box helicase [Chlamydiota bacterium]